MPSSLSVRLFVELLELRETPAAFSTPWPDGEHLTLSFVPDGTAIGSVPSNLGQVFQSLGPAAKIEILRAFQTWAVAANLNIGLVNDNGAAFGTGGSVLGDSRFGDIRIGGRSLPNDVPPITSPYNLYGTHSGDVVLRPRRVAATCLRYSSRKLGTRWASATARTWPRPCTSTTAAPATDSPPAISPRSARSTGIDSRTLAKDRTAMAPLGPPPVLGHGGRRTEHPGRRGRLPLHRRFAQHRRSSEPHRGGLSLLAARAELVDSHGQVVAVASASDLTNNDLVLTAGRLHPFETYFVQVTAARADEFGVGSYQLDVNQSNVLTPVIDLLGGLLDETGLNDTLVTATQLLSGATVVGQQTEFHARGGFGSKSDVDYFRFAVPTSSDGLPVTMLMTIWGENAS